MTRPGLSSAVIRRAALAVLVMTAIPACASSLDDLTAALSPSGTPSAPTAPPASASGSPAPGASGESGPAIVVRTPAAGDEIVSPVTIAGTADVFEATVSVEVLDENGQPLAATFATATCGSGCRGEFETELAFFTDRRQPGTIQVFESSAEDGSPVNVVSIPVVLVPGP